MLSPSVGPDGVLFSQEKQSIRLEYADNINLGPRWMIAFWIKTFHGVPTSPTPRNETLLTQARYDNRNETPHTFSIGLMSSTVTASKLGIRFSAFLYDDTTGKYSYVETSYQSKLDIQDGWLLLVVGLDNVLNPAKTTVTFKMRTNLATSREYTSVDFVGLKWLQRQQDKQDIYLGGFCDLFGATKTFGNPIRGTVSRMWIWRDILIDGLMGDTFLDRYFFRITSATASPVCTDGVITGTVSQILPCKMCIVGLNPPTALTAATTLSCLSEEKTNNQMFIAYWDFNDVNSAQYIEDKSGNNYHLYKGTPADNEPNDPFRISNQGYLFEMNFFAQSMYPIQLHNYMQFTFDVWVRRESPPPAASTGTNAFVFNIDRTVGASYFLDFGIQISDTNQRIFVTMNNKLQQSPQYSNILKDNTWNYFAVSIYRYSVGVTKGCRMRFMANVEALNSVINCQAFDGFTINTADTMSLISYRNYIFNKIRIFQHAMSIDEIPQMVKTSAANQCAKKLGQTVCTICPENGNCMTQCNQNQFENPTNETCDACHQFCGGCSMAGKDGCLFCTRNTASLAYYNPQFGNCTCKGGYYFNSTTDDCQLCNAQCTECFGPSNYECLTCSNTAIFYPPTYCVADCEDPIVKGDGRYGYFKGLETIAGAAFAMCIKCHPYCTVCYGTQNGECNECQDGYFLQIGSCIDNCPDFQYPDMTIKACAACHPNCLKCSGSAINKCTKCYEAKDAGGNVIQKKYLQGGLCKNQCDGGYWPDTEQVCQPCHTACGTCTTPRNTTCGSCTSGYFLEWLGFACKFDCVDGKYGDTATNMCLLCHYSCLTCRGAGPDQCKVCALGYLRRKSLCVVKCEEGEFEVEGACYQCDKKCLTCFGPKDYECYTCADNTVTGVGYYYYNNKCVEKCPNGFYPDNFEKVCKSCKTVCSACDSWDFCTECIEGPYQLNNGECTFFQCMDSQYRAVKPTLACYDCDASCLTCQGMSRFDCLTCRPAHKFSAQSCLTCKDQAGMTEAADPNYPGCIELCGDGFNFGMLECDDGNLVNGDGCDSKCFVEKGWECSGGSMLMPDSCSDVQSPTPRISLINKKNEIFISFDEEVVLTEDLLSGEAKFTITIKGNQPSYNFEYTIPTEAQPGDHLQNLVIGLTFMQSLRGNELVTVRFLNSHTFEDNAGNGIVQAPLTGYLSQFSYRDPFWSNFLDGICDYIVFAMSAIGIINIIGAQLWGVSTTGLWTSVVYLQMITMVPLLTVNWPMFVDTFFGRLGSVINFETDVIPNLFFDSLIAPAGSKTLIEPPLNERFASFRREYSNFFYLSGRKLVLWSALIFSYPLIWYLKRNYADKHKFCKLWEKLEQRYRYNFFLRGIILSYVSMTLASTLNIYQMQFLNMSTTISCFVAVAFQISMIYLPILMMNILQRNYDKMETPKFLVQYSTIVNELDLTHPSKYMFYAVFLMRRIVYVFMIVLFSNKLSIAIGGQCVSSVLMILYVLVARPFKRKVTTFLTIIGELFVSAFHVVGLAVTDPDQPDAENEQFGFLIVLMIAGYLAIAFISIFAQVIPDLVAECRSRSKQSHDIREKEDAEFKYKKWKKRRQLVKREIALKEKQKLLDQHENLVNQYRAQQELEEERRALEEEEQERIANGEFEEGQPLEDHQSPGGWRDEASAYMNDGGYDNSYLIQQQQQMMQNPYPQMQQYQAAPEQQNNYQQRGASRNAVAGEALKLNKNSGGSSDEALRQNPQQMDDAQVDELYGEEYGYGEEYNPEVAQYGPETAQPPEPAQEEGAQISPIEDEQEPDFDRRPSEGPDEATIITQKKKPPTDEDMWN